MMVLEERSLKEMMLIAILFALTCFIYSRISPNPSDVDTPEEAIEENYTFYLDGEKIDATKYNFRGYYLDYNEEDKTVTVTKRVSIF